MNVPTLSGVEGAPWPPVLHGEPAVLAALVQQLDASQWLSAKALERRRAPQLAALVDHHARYSGHFRQRLAQAGLTAEEAALPSGFARLPLLTRRDIQVADDLFAATLPPLHGPAEAFNTSGSTGEPVHVRRTALNRLDWLAMAMRDHLWHRRDLSGRFCAIRAHLPAPQVLPDWGPPAALLHPTGPSLGIPMTLPIAEQMRLLRAFRPTSLLAYASDLAGLLDHLERDPGGLESIADVRTMGEVVTPELRARARALLGVDIADSYSSQELGYIALQCPASGLYHVMAETVIAEVLDAGGLPAAAGTIGRLVLTDLRNFATPLIRYEIGDYAEVAPPCRCGRGLPTLARIVGRMRNLIVRPDGSRNWPLVGYARYRELAGVIQYQFVQHAIDRIEMRLLVERPLAPAEEERLREHVRDALDFPYGLEFTYLDHRIPPGPSGKFEEFISRVTLP